MRRSLALWKAESSRSDQRRDFPGPFEGIAERSKDLSSVAEKSLVEIIHTKKLLKFGFIQGWRKISNDEGMLEERAEARTGEVMTQELKHPKRSHNSSLRNVLGGYRDLIIPLLQVKPRENS